MKKTNLCCRKVWIIFPLYGSYCACNTIIMRVALDICICLHEAYIQTSFANMLIFLSSTRTKRIWPLLSETFMIVQVRSDFKNRHSMRKNVRILNLWYLRTIRLLVEDSLKADCTLIAISWVTVKIHVIVTLLWNDLKLLWLFCFLICVS